VLNVADLPVSGPSGTGSKTDFRNVPAGGRGHWRERKINFEELENSL